MAITFAPVTQIDWCCYRRSLFSEKHLRGRLAAASVIVLGVIAVAHG
jgi:hypothetical protein